MWKSLAGVLMVGLFSAACTSLEFSDGWRGDGVTFYDPVPALVLSCNKDNEVIVRIESLPGRQRSVRPHSGMVGGKLSVTFQNGMITTFNQEPQSLSNDVLTTLLDVAGVGLAGANTTSRACPLTAPTMIFTLRFDAEGVVQGLDRLNIPADAWAATGSGRTER